MFQRWHQAKAGFGRPLASPSCEKNKTLHLQDNRSNPNWECFVSGIEPVGYIYIYISINYIYIYMYIYTHMDLYNYMELNLGTALAWTPLISRSQSLPGPGRPLTPRGKPRRCWWPVEASHPPCCAANGGPPASFSRTKYTKWSPQSWRWSLPGDKP